MERVERAVYVLRCHGEAISSTWNRAEADRMRAAQKKSDCSGIVVPTPPRPPAGKYIVKDDGSIWKVGSQVPGSVSYDMAEARADAISKARAAGVGSD